MSLIFTCVSAVSAADNLTGDFNDLAGDIDSNHTVVLQKDYRLTNCSQKHIVINKSITIDGAGHVIEAPDVSRVFWVVSDNVVIKNINFVNAGRCDLAGGVISWWGNSGTLMNCNFTNNSAVSAGGAVLWSGNDGTITNCNFINNTVNIGDAVSLTKGDGFNRSQLHKQIVNAEGGALYIDGNNISINFCNFLDNRAMLNGGAVSISWGCNVSISSSRFKNNSASYGGAGAIDINGQNVSLYNSSFKSNSPNELFINCPDTRIVNCEIENESAIETFYDYKIINSFDALYEKISDAAENSIIILDRDYQYVNGSNKGILITKPITIDGAGHTLDGNLLSRMFNITSDNVTLKNINFINGNAYGRYGGIAGGGAIYWNGANGLVLNCNFTNNHGRGIEDDPYDKEETIILEDGTVIYNYRFRPMGAKTNEGGAIVWNGTNGTVKGCLFENNGVGYPNSGGAICWKGASGRVIESEFYNNDGWAGSAICWTANDGFITSSSFLNSGIGSGILWFGANGTITNSILLDLVRDSAIQVYGGNMTVENSWWGDTLNSASYKIKAANNWLVLNVTANKNIVHKGDEVVIKFDLGFVTNSSGAVNRFTQSNITNFKLYLSNGDAITLNNGIGEYRFKATQTGKITLDMKRGKLDVTIKPLTKITSNKDITKYYKASCQYKVRVYGADGKIASNKRVKFTIGKNVYYRITDKNGYAILKISKKPGKYTVTAQFDKVKVKNKITIKTTLITKNVNKKFKKSGKFNVKVLNSKGKILKNKVVKVKFKGKTYKIKTNKNGIATFKIPKSLKVGKYTVKTSYGGLTNSNKIVVKK